MQQSWCNLPHFDEDTLNFCIRKVVKIFEIFNFFFYIWNGCAKSLHLHLVFASRVSEITNLRVNYLTKQSSVYTFAVSSLTKPCQRSKKSSQAWSFAICQVTTSSVYVRQLIRILRRVGGSQFLVEHIKLHKHLSPSPVSRWFGKLLEVTGTNK